MTFRNILILTWLVFVPAVISLLVSFFLPEKMFAHIGTSYSIKGILVIYATLCFCFLAWIDFLYYIKKLGFDEKPGIWLFALFFVIFSGYHLMFFGIAILTFLKGESLNQLFFNWNFFPCLLLLVCWFLMRLIFDAKEPVEEE